MPGVLLVDDSLLVRAVLASFVHDADPRAEILEAWTPEHAIALYALRWPDLVLLDLTIPSNEVRISTTYEVRPGTPATEGGLRTLTAILDIDPHARVAIVTALD